MAVYWEGNDISFVDFKQYHEMRKRCENCESPREYVLIVLRASESSPSRVSWSWDPLKLYGKLFQKSCSRAFCTNQN